MWSRFRLFGAMSAGASIAAVVAPVINKKHPVQKQHIQYACYGEAVIYTWRPSLHDGCIGHQAVLIRGSYKEVKEQIYISFWPDAISDEAMSLSNIPTKYVNTDGEFRKGIHEDIRLEGKAPDDVTIVHNLDYAAMRQFNINIRRDAEAKALAYKFCRVAPDVSRYVYQLLHLNNRYSSSSPLLLEPFSETLMREKIDLHEMDSREVKSNNCTGVVREVIENGGFPKKSFYVMPWGDTPYGQKKEIEFIGATEIIDKKMKDYLVALAGGASEMDDVLIMHKPGNKL